MRTETVAGLDDVPPERELIHDCAQSRGSVSPAAEAVVGSNRPTQCPDSLTSGSVLLIVVLISSNGEGVIFMEDLDNGRIFRPLESMDFSNGAVAHPTCSNALVEDLFDDE